MVCLLKELLIIEFIGILMMFWSEDCCCSNLITSTVINSSIFWYLYLTLVSAFIFFPVSLVICNHLRSSGMTLINLLWCLREFWLIVFCGFCGIYYDFQSGVIIYIFGVFTMIRPKRFARDFLSLIFFTLHFTGMM